MVPFISGILLGTKLDCTVYTRLFIFLISFSLFVLFQFRRNFLIDFKYRHVSGILFLVCVFFCGLLLENLNGNKMKSDHFSTFKNTKHLLVQVESISKKNKLKIKCVAKVLAVKTKNNWEKVTGKILLNVKDKIKNIQIGNQYLMPSKYYNIQGPLNPSDFNFKDYLSHNGIFHQAFINANQFRYLKNAINPLYRIAQLLRNSLLSGFEQAGLKDESFAVAQALLFGENDALDSDLIQAYSTSGVLHVLSVSGMHVGIIFGFIQLLFSFFSNKSHIKWIKCGIIIFLIWFYALLTGLCPSVMRSAIMISFIVFGQLLSRKPTILNSISASAFLLLAFNPHLIFNIGFQLSYLAVTGIILIQPLIPIFSNHKSVFLQKLGALISVSLAAQLATLPIGLYYFHQFPTYFLLGNLIIIPISSVILYAGILASIFSFWTLGHDFLVKFLASMIEVMNGIIVFLSKLPMALISGIEISFTICCLLYMALMFIIVWRKWNHAGMIKYILICIACVLMFNLQNLITNQNQKLLVIFNSKNNSIIDVIQGQSHVVLGESKFNNKRNLFAKSVTDFWHGLSLNKPKFIDINSSAMSDGIILFDTLRLKIVTSQYNYKKDLFDNANLIVIKNNPHLSFKFMPIEYRNKLFVADASNDKQHIYSWRKQAKQLNIRFHATSQNGAFVYKGSN